MSSILDLDSCAYAKGMLFELFTSNVGIAMEEGESQPKFMARLHIQRFTKYNEQFKNCDKFNVTYKTFVSIFPKLKERLNLWGKRYSADRKTFLNNYNSEEWNKTLYETKVKHSLFNCDVCKEDPELKQIYKNYPLKKFCKKRNADVCNKENIETKPTPKQVKAVKRKMKNEIEEIKKKRV